MVSHTERVMKGVSADAASQRRQVASGRSASRVQGVVVSLTTGGLTSGTDCDVFCGTPPPIGSSVKFDADVKMLASASENLTATSPSGEGP